MNTTPKPASLAAVMYFSTTPDCLTPNAAVGSSRMSTRAPKNTARAIATHCRCPPDSEPIGASTSGSSMPIFVNSVSVVARIALASSENGNDFLRSSWPRKKLRHTGISGTTARF